MDRWCGKVAIVTGTSAGIGASIAEKLVQHGLKVAGLSRRIEKVEDLASKINGKTSGHLYPIKCDVTKEEDILSAFNWVKENLGPIHILVNNAGMIRDGFLHDGKTSDWQQMISTNITGLCICTREAVQDMLKNKIDGHVVHINSIAGHKVTIHDPPSASVYPASKHAVTALTESLRQEMAWLKNGIKVTSISPGLTDTEIFDHGGSKRFSPEAKKEMPMLLPEDIGDAVIYALGTPPRVQVHELTIKPVGEAV